jgi:cytochrome d ubiquinol oxidase subunit I
MAVWFATIVAPLQIAAGDLHGLAVQRHQPMKVAAMEALWQTRASAPFVVAAWPDQDAQRNRFALEIPGLGSVILAHNPGGTVKGLDEVPRADQPPVAPVFFAFRVMVALGLWFLLLGALGALLWWRGRLTEQRRYLRLLVLSAPLGFVATIAGWLVAEIGRQPWVVHGLLRTAESVSPLQAPAVAASLLAFIAVYFIVFGAGVLYILRLMSHPPQRGEAGPERDQPVRAAGITPAPQVAEGGN